MTTTNPPTAIMTGASSGVGLYATLALVKRGWHVVMACRDVAKATREAQALGLKPDQFTPMLIDLARRPACARSCRPFGRAACRLMRWCATPPCICRA